MVKWSKNPGCIVSVELIGQLQRVVWRPADHERTGDERVIGRLDDGTGVIGDAAPREFVEGETYRFFGDWDTRPAKGGKTYGNGKTLLFRSFIVAEPASRNGVIEYLAKHCHGIGPAIAARLYDRFRGDAVRVLRLNPEEAVAAVDRLTIEVARAASDKLQGMAANEATVIELTALFSGRGFPQSTIKTALNTWGVAAAKKIKRDPFVLLFERFRGIGFARCDALYLALGRPAGKLRRQTLAIWDLLDNDSDGHTWIPATELQVGLAWRIGGARLRFARALQLGIRAGLFAVATGRHGQLVALRQVADSEQRLATDVLRLLAGAPPEDADGDQIGEGVDDELVASGVARDCGRDAAIPDDCGADCGGSDWAEG